MAVAVSVLLSLLQVGLLLCLGYHYFLAVASIREPRVPGDPSRPVTRFAVAIPAHNEAAVLPATLAHLGAQRYPPDLFDVHVVADHCTDDTVRVVHDGGAVAHERDAQPKGRKAYALQWLLARILDEDARYDAVAIFDADSHVAPDFLDVMDRYLQAGEQLLQGQHVVSNPQDSMVAAMAAVDMRLNNRLRNQSRRNLGFACRLMGDAMVFDASILRARGWPTDSMIEDRELGYELLLRGIAAGYVPQARSFGQGASSWKQAKPQRLRWYRGMASIRRQLARRLVGKVVRQPSAMVLDGALELLMPSYSLLSGMSVLNVGLVAILAFLGSEVRDILGVTGSALLVAAWALYPVVGLIIDRAPVWAFRALLLGPVYLAWRLWISILVRLRGDRIAWVRTRRREEIDHTGL